MPTLLDNLLTLIFIISMLYIILYNSYTLVALISIILLGVIISYTYLKTNNYYIIASFLLIFAIKNIDLNRTLKLMYTTKFIFLAVHIIAYFISLVYFPDSISYVYRDGIKRQNFFIGHPNTFAMIAYWCMFEFIYVNYKKLKDFHFILFIILSYLIKYYTDSNTGFFIFIFVIIAVFLDKKNVHIEKVIMRFLAKYSFAFFSIFFSLITIFYSNLSGIALELYNKLDKYLTNRLIYGAFAYDKYGLTFFGKSLYFDDKIQWHTYWFDGMTFDNTFLWILVAFGIFYLVILSIGFYLFSKNASNIQCIFVVAYTLYAIMESYILNAVLCFPLLFLGLFVFNNKKSNSIKYPSSQNYNLLKD